MPARNIEESIVVDEFLQHYFGDSFTPMGLSEAEEVINRQVLEYVGDRFGRKKYILGLALDFTLLAQQLSRIDAAAKRFRPGLTVEQLFDRYTRIEQRGATQANTLTLQYGSATLGIRSIEEAVVEFFHRLNRSGYPSAYVYNTGMWRPYQGVSAYPVLGKRLLHTNWRAYCPAPVTPQRQHAFISPVGQRADGRAVVQPVAAHYRFLCRGQIHVAHGLGRHVMASRCLDGYISTENSAVTVAHP
jgi:hypothetical protein